MSKSRLSFADRLANAKKNLLLIKDRENQQLQAVLKSNVYKFSIYLSWFIISFAGLILLDYSVRGTVSNEIVSEIIAEKESKTKLYYIGRFSTPSTISNNPSYYVKLFFESGRMTEIPNPNPYHTPRTGDTLGVEYSIFLGAPKDVEIYKWGEVYNSVKGLFGFYFLITLVLAVVFSIVNIMYTKKGILRGYSISLAVNSIVLVWFAIIYF